MGNELTKTVELSRFHDIAQSLAAGNKLPLADLEWYILFAEKHWFHREPGTEGEVLWRNKSKQTVYNFEGVTLRITDSEISPVYMWVDYSPEDCRTVRFSREANEFLRKFEPVYEARTWQPVDQPSADRLPGALA